jgi:hypothetical protein
MHPLFKRLDYWVIRVSIADSMRDSNMYRSAVTPLRTANAVHRVTYSEFPMLVATV